MFFVFNIQESECERGDGSGPRSMSADFLHYMNTIRAWMSNIDMLVEYRDIRPKTIQEMGMKHPGA